MNLKLEYAEKKIGQLEDDIKDYKARIIALEKRIDNQQMDYASLENKFDEAIDVLESSYQVDCHLVYCADCKAYGEACDEAVKMQERFEEHRDSVLFNQGRIEV